MHLEKAAGGRFCSQESREKFFPPGNWMTIPSPYVMLETVLGSGGYLDGEYIRNAGTGVRKREGAGGDVFTGNDRNAG